MWKINQEKLTNVMDDIRRSRDIVQREWYEDHYRQGEALSIVIFRKLNDRLYKMSRR
jgi:hypothetical protein